MKDNKPNKNAQVDKRKDYITNKLLLVFTLAFAVLIYVMNISNGKHSLYMNTAWNVSKVVTVVAALLTVGGIIMMIVECIMKRDVKYKLFSGKNITLAMLFITVCSGALAIFLVHQTIDIVTLLYIFIPMVVVLYIIYYSYQREFFLIALSAAISGIAIYLLGASDIISMSAIDNQIMMIIIDILVIGAVVLSMLVLAVFTVIAQIGKGKIKLFGKSFEVFKPDARYAILYLSFILMLALLALSVVFMNITFYIVLGLVAYLVLVGIYYTIKLI